MKRWMKIIFMLLTFSISFLTVSADEAGKEELFSSDEQEITIPISVKGYGSSVLIRDEEGKLLRKVSVREGTPYIYKETVRELKTYIRYISQEIQPETNVTYDRTEYRVGITTYLEEGKPVSTAAAYRQDKKVSDVEFVNQSSPSAVQTGDETPLKAMIILASLSFIALTGLIAIRKRAAGNGRAERK